MKHSKYKFLVLLILVSFPSVLYADTQKEIALISIESMKLNDFSLLTPYLMNEIRFIQLAKLTQTNFTKEEIAKASNRSFYSGKNSLIVMIRIMKYNNFDIKEARLKNIYYRTSTGISVFDEQGQEGKKLRIDLVIELMYKNMTFLIRLDDCFLLNGKRYLGDGFKFEGHKGFHFQLDPKTKKDYENTRH